MDETDIRLCQMLFINPRTPIRELSDRLNISIQATHRRIQLLRDEGLIHRFRASLSIGYLSAIRVLIEGISQGKSDEVEEALRKNEQVHSVFIGEGQPHYFLECLIRDINDLDLLVEYLRNRAQIPKPNVLFDSQVRFGKKVLDTQYRGPTELSRIDFQIINVLNEDARMSIGDIAQRCDASARTVKRRLERMVADGAIDFSIDWRPGNASGLTAMMAIILRRGVDQRMVRNDLNNLFGGNIFVITTLSNIPGLISCNAWASSIKRYNELIDEMKRCHGVVDVHSSVLKDGWVQDTWRDRLLREEVRKQAK